MILKNAGNIVRAERFRNIASLVHCQSNTTVILIDTQFAEEVA